MTLVTTALQIAKEHDIAIIACGEDKAPIHKGWRGAASKDPKKIKKMFSDPRAALVGVPCGKANDIMAFDIDYRAGNTKGRNEKLKAFEDELLDHHEAGVRIHTTRNGGKHIIMLNPSRKMPRNVMPKLELIYDGFQFIWPTPGSGYEVVLDTPLAELDEPEEKFTKIWEKMEGMPAGGGMMSDALADKVMHTDGEYGTRHDALLRMTHDWVYAIPREELKDPELVARTFEKAFRETFGASIEETRLEELMYWRFEDGALCGSDLGNALKKPLARRCAEEFAIERMVELSKDDRPTDPVVAEVVEPDPYRKTADTFTIDVKEDVPHREWVYGDMLERGQVSMLTGDGGTGKTMTAMVHALACASGEKLLDKQVIGGPKQVIMWCGEETQMEARRRFTAAARYHDVSSEGILALTGDTTPLKLAKRQRRDGEVSVVPNHGDVDLLMELIDQCNADVLIVDPLVTIHDLSESDNVEMNAMMGVLRDIARQRNIAILVVHHSAKADEGGSRGASAIVNAARHHERLIPMDEQEAIRAHVDPEDRYGYVGVTSGKTNNSKHFGGKTYYHLDTYALGNGSPAFPQGDVLGVPVKWDIGKIPNLMHDIGKCLQAIRDEWADMDVEEADKRVRQDVRSSLWVGILMGEALGLSWTIGKAEKDMHEDEIADLDSVKHLHSTMVEQGIIESKNVKDRKRMQRPAAAASAKAAAVLKRLSK